MKRFFSSLAIATTLLAIASPALASPNLRTRNSQPRMDRRAVKNAALAAYRNRGNLAYRRERYNKLVQRLMPAFLTVTGGGNRISSDLLKINRPNARTVNSWTLPNHCTEDSRRCGTN